MGFSDSSILAKVCLILVLVAILVQIIGVATPSWLTYEGGHSGLWKICGQNLKGDTECFSYSDFTTPLATLPDWMKASRAFGIIGILVLVAVAIFHILCVFVFTREGKKMFYILTMILTFVAGGSILLSIIIYGAKKADLDPLGAQSLGYSFGLCVASGVLALLTGVLLAVDNSKAS